jgi:hypothetical protein
MADPKIDAVEGVDGGAYEFAAVGLDGVEAAGGNRST